MEVDCKIKICHLTFKIIVLIFSVACQYFKQVLQKNFKNKDKYIVQFQVLKVDFILSHFINILSSMLLFKMFLFKICFKNMNMYY